MSILFAFRGGSCAALDRFGFGGVDDSGTKDRRMCVKRSKIKGDKCKRQRRRQLCSSFTQSWAESTRGRRGVACVFNHSRIRVHFYFDRLYRALGVAVQPSMSVSV